MVIPPDGFHGSELSETAYRSNAALAQSTAKKLLEPGGSAKVKWSLTNPQPHRRVFDLGHAAHSLVLGAGDELVDIGTDLRTTKAKEAEKMARAAGRIPLRTADYKIAHAMAEQIQGHELALELLSQGQPEVAMFATLEDGLRVKGRADYITGDDLIVDYKTTADASPHGFAKSAAKYGYHFQSAWYRMLARHCGIQSPRFIFIAQEKEAPYLVNVIELDDEFEDIGESDMRQALAIWRECVATDTWPGYDAEPTRIQPPRWMRSNSLDPAVEQAFEDFLNGFANE